MNKLMFEMSETKKKYYQRQKLKAAEYKKKIKQMQIDA